MTSEFVTKYTSKSSQKQNHSPTSSFDIKTMALVALTGRSCLHDTGVIKSLQEVPAAALFTRLHYRPLTAPFDRTYYFKNLTMVLWADLCGWRTYK